MLIEIIFLQELSKDLSRNPHQLPAKVILIQRIGFSTKKKKSLSPLLHLYLHLLHYFDNEQIFIFQKKTKKKKKNKKKETKFSKKKNKIIKKN